LLQNKTVVNIKKKQKQNRGNLYICFLSTSKMIFIKKANILHLLLLLVMVCSCKNETKVTTKPEIKDANLPKGVLPKMKPLVNETPKLTASYIAEKKREIDSFYNKNWPNNSMNGGFLVAKNGQII
jgi:hypothetical protein